jgi:hypothetical protein
MMTAVARRLAALSPGRLRVAVDGLTGAGKTSFVALRRGIARDSAAEGAEEAIRVHRDRYGVAAGIYLAEVNPRALADIVIDNTLRVPPPHRRAAGRGWSLDTYLTGAVTG